jgi:hypothetical protein
MVFALVVKWLITKEIAHTYSLLQMLILLNKLQVARLDDVIEKYNQAELKKAA